MFLRFRTFHALLLILTGAMALMFLITSVKFLPVTGDNMYPEAAGVLTAQRWSFDFPLYGDYRQSPYLITHFPPLWYALLAGAASAGLPDLNSLTLFGRIISLICLLGLMAVGYRWNRRMGLSPSMSALTVTLYLSFPILIPWAVTARPDFPALLLAFVSIYLVAFQQRKGTVALAAAVAALAFLMRHNAVAAPVAIVLWMFWQRRWKDSVVFCTVWGLVVGVTLTAFQLSSHGLLLLNLSGAKFGPIALTYGRDTLFRILLGPGYGFALILFSLSLFCLLDPWKRNDPPTRLISVYLMVALGFAVFGSAAAGAAVNHYLEPVLIMAVLAPSGVARIGEAWKENTSLGVFALAMMLMVLLPSADEQWRQLMRSKPEDLTKVAKLLNGRYVFTDIPYLAARTSLPQLLDLVSLTYSERTKSSSRWSSDLLVQTLQDKAYEVVILQESPEAPYDPIARYPRYPRLDSDTRVAIVKNYSLCYQLDGSYVYGRILSNSPSPGNSCPSLAALQAVNHENR